MSKISIELPLLIGINTNFELMKMSFGSVFERDVPFTRKISYIIDFKKIINDKLWKMISNKYKQTIYYEEFNQLIE